MNNTLHLETQTKDPPISHKRWDKGPTNWCMILWINTLNLANLSNFIYCLCGWEVERQVPCWHRGLFLRNAYHCYNLLSYIVIATAKISTQNAHRGAEGNFAQTPHDDELQVIVRNHQQFQENCLTPQASLAATLMLKTWNGVNGGHLLNVKELYCYYATWRCWADFIEFFKHHEVRSSFDTTVTNPWKCATLKSRKASTTRHCSHRLRHTGFSRNQGTPGCSWHRSPAAALDHLQYLVLLRWWRSCSDFNGQSQVFNSLLGVEP